MRYGEDLVVLLRLVLILIGIGFDSAAPAATPADFEFSGYARSDFMRNVYLGRLDLVSLPKRSQQLDQTIAPLIQADLAVSIVLYNDVYSKRCMAESTEPATDVITQFYDVTYQGGIEVNREPGSRHVSTVRNRFLKTYNLANAMPTLLRLPNFVSGKFMSTVTDLDRFVREQGCRSEVVSQFEENLHRAFTNEPPVQASRTGSERAPLFYRGCTNVVSSLKSGIALEPACSCLHDALWSSLHHEDFWALEDHFVRSSFLMASVSQVGLRDKAAECFK